MRRIHKQNDRHIGGITIEAVRSAVSMGDIVKKYGFKVGRNGRIPCPFHHGRDDNLSFDGRVFNCFVCGAKGDAIEFVMRLFGISFSEAIERLCDDFGIATVNSFTSSRSERMRLIEKQREAFERGRQIELQRKALEDECIRLQDRLWELEDYLWQYEPKRGDEELHPLYKTALDNIEAVRWELNNKERMIENFGRDNDYGT